MKTGFKQFKTKALKNPAVKAEYDVLEPEYKELQQKIKMGSEK